MADGDLSARELAALDALYGDSGADGDDEMLAGWRRVRDVVRGARDAGFDQDPPQRIDAILMAAARQRTPHPTGAWARIKRWLAPLAAHPALASAATLVVVGGAASVMYMRGQAKVVQPEVPVAPHRSEGTGASAGSMTALPTETRPDLPTFREAAEAERMGGPGSGSAGAGSGSGSAEELPQRQRPHLDPYRAGSGEKGANHAPDVRDGIVAGTGGGAGGGEGDGKDDGEATFQRPLEIAGGDEQSIDKTKLESKPEDPGHTTVTGGVQMKMPITDQAPPPPPPPDNTTTVDEVAAGDGGGAARDSRAKARAQAEQLTRQARTAARKKDCAAVRLMAKRVKSLDKAYYSATFAADRDIKSCL